MAPYYSTDINQMIVAVQHRVKIRYRGICSYLTNNHLIKSSLNNLYTLHLSTFPISILSFQSIQSYSIYTIEITITCANLSRSDSLEGNLSSLVVIICSLSITAETLFYSYPISFNINSYYPIFLFLNPNSTPHTNLPSNSIYQQL